MKIIIPEYKIKSIVRNVIKENINELDIYHGTTANFDNFDVAYIGNGWGTSYGWGFYLTDNIDAAKQYSGNKIVVHVRVPNTKYLYYGKTVPKNERIRIARLFFKYYTTEDEYGKSAYPTTELQREFWNYDCKYLMEPGDAGDIYGSIASILGSDKEASMFLYRIGYKGICFPGTNGETGRKFKNYVMFNPNDIEIIKKTDYSQTSN